MFHHSKIAALSFLVTLSCGVACSPSTSNSPSPLVSPVHGAAPVRTATESPAAETASSARVKTLKITVLSTMLADEGIGEWGFAALVDADGRRILFDTGFRRDTVLKNAEELGIDLTTITDVVLSHHHDDHVGGLMKMVTIRRLIQ